MKLSKKTKICNVVYLICIFLMGFVKAFNKHIDGNYFSFVIFVYLDGLWISQVKRRISHRKERSYIVWVALLCMLYILLKTFNHLFEHYSLISRYLWYMCYVPQIFIVLMIYFACLYIDKSGDYRPNKYLKVLYLVASLLALSILSNDYHNLAFVFIDVDILSFDYGFLYYLLIAWIICLLVLCYVLILNTSITRDNNSKIFLPLVPLLLLLFYNLNAHSFISSYYDAPEMFCLCFMAFVELLMQTRLLINNDNYSELLINTSLNGGVFDDDLNLIYMTNDAFKASDTNILKALNKDVLLNDETILLRAKKISSGYVYWCKDITPLNEINNRLKEIVEMLNEENSVINSANELIKKREAIKKEKKIYDYISIDLDFELDKIYKIIKNPCANEDEFEKQIKLACIYMAYVKRRSNLLLFDLNGKSIDSMELNLALKESLDYLNYYGFITNLNCSGQENIKAEIVLDIHYMFEKIIESLLPNTYALLINVHYLKEGFNVYVEVSGDDLKEINLDKKYSYRCVKEDDTLYISFGGLYV